MRSSQSRGRILRTGHRDLADIHRCPGRIYTVALSIPGRNHEWGGDTTGLRLSNFKNELKGCGPFRHDDPRDRPLEVFGGTTTVHFGREQSSHVLVPVIPPKAQPITHRSSWPRLFVTDTGRQLGWPVPFPRCQRSGRRALGSTRYNVGQITGAGGHQGDLGGAFTHQSNIPAHRVVTARHALNISSVLGGGSKTTVRMPASS